MIKSSAALILVLTVLGCTALPGNSQVPNDWMNAQSELVQVSGTQLHLRDEGEEFAETILFVHGFGSSLHSWETVSEILRPEFRTISFDLPGFGLSAADSQNDYTDERTHEIILATMRRRDIETLTIVGHSLGGRIAWTFAAAHPEKVNALVLIAPDGYESPMFRYGRAGRVTPVTRLLVLILPRFAVRWALDVSYGQTPPPPETVNRYYSFLRQAHVKAAILERTRQTILEDPDEILPDVMIPTLLIWGQQDRIIPPANVEDYLDALPNARSVQLAGVGHLPQEETPERVAQLIGEFLAGRSLQ